MVGGKGKKGKERDKHSHRIVLTIVGWILSGYRSGLGEKEGRKGKEPKTRLKKLGWAPRALRAVQGKKKKKREEEKKKNHKKTKKKKEGMKGGL